MIEFMNNTVWLIIAFVCIVVYIIVVWLFIPLTSLSIIQSPPLPIERTQEKQYVIIEERIRNYANRNHFVVGDLVVFSFNITNTYNQTLAFSYNSSIPFLNYSSHRSFNLDYLQSRNITEELPISSEGNNVFRFQVGQYIGNSDFHYKIEHILQAISFSDELSIIVSKSTFTITMIIGIPSILYGVKILKELYEKKKLETIPVPIPP